MDLNDSIIVGIQSGEGAEILRRYQDTEVYFPLRGDFVTEGSVHPEIVGGNRIDLQTANLEDGKMALFYASRDDARLGDRFAGRKPRTLTIDRANAAARRKESLRGVETRKGFDRDEYPPAMFAEGGRGASVRHIRYSDNRGAGACIGGQCRGLPDGARVQIKIVE